MDSCGHDIADQIVLSCLSYDEEGTDCAWVWDTAPDTRR